MRMGPGTLYGSIQRMLKDGLIVESLSAQIPRRATTAKSAGATTA